MIILYGLICFKNFEQVSNLIDILNVNGNIIVVHVDLKSDELYKALIERYKNNNSVHFISNRIEIRWGGYQQILCETKIFQEALKYNFDYFKLISGSDLPVKTDYELKTFLTKNDHKEYIECFKDVHQKWRLHLYHNEIYPWFRKHFNLLQFTMEIIDFFAGWKIGNKNFENYDGTMGTNWILVTHDFLKYVNDYIEKYKFTDLFKNAICGDEVFVQLIFKDSPYYKNIYKNERGGALLYVHWALYNSPRILTEKDLKHLDKPECFFARKFELTYNREFVESIYARHKNNK